MAHRVSPAKRNNVLVCDEQLLEYQLCSGTGRGIHISIRAYECADAGRPGVESNGVVRNDAARTPTDEVAGSNFSSGASAACKQDEFSRRQQPSGVSKYMENS